MLILNFKWKFVFFLGGGQNHLRYNYIPDVLKYLLNFRLASLLLFWLLKFLAGPLQQATRAIILVPKFFFGALSSSAKTKIHSLIKIIFFSFLSFF